MCAVFSQLLILILSYFHAHTVQVFTLGEDVGSIAKTVALHFDAGVVCSGLREEMGGFHEDTITDACSCRNVLQFFRVRPVIGTFVIPGGFSYAAGSFRHLNESFERNALANGNNYLFTGGLILGKDDRVHDRLHAAALCG